MLDKVLLVEADARRRAALRDALLAGGLKILESASSTEAMQVVRNEALGGLVVADESRQLALKGLCGQVRRGSAGAHIFVLLHAESDRAKVAAAAEGVVLIDAGATAEVVARHVLSRFGVATPEVWRYQKTRAIKRSKLWEVHAAIADGGPEVMLTQLSEQFARDDELRTEFVQAAAGTQSLSGPNLLRVVAIGGSGDIPFVATELAPGATLQDLRKRARETNGAAGWMSPRVAAWVASELAAALELAHAASVVHGAVAPEHVWIAADGRVFLLHLGIAGLCSMLERSMRSSVGLAIPQPYLAPEQILHGQADVRTDAFQLGIVLYEMLAQQSPFLRDSAHDTIEAIVGGKLAELDAVPAEIADVTFACLEKNPSFRPQAVAAIRAKLAAIVERVRPAPQPPRQDTPAPSRGLLGRLFAAGSGAAEPPEPAPPASPSPQAELAGLYRRLF